MQPKTIKICILAGEASGDYLGAQLMSSLLKNKHIQIEFIGVGGNLMSSNGLKSLFPMADLSVMGIAEVIPRLPKLISRINQTVKYISEQKPDILITIDSPDFSFRVVRKLKDQNHITKIHYVAPTVWAWRPERAQLLANMYDGLICLYPFEPQYFKNLDIKTSYIGHPLLEKINNAKRVDVHKELNLNSKNKILGVLFGSRIGEINKVGPEIRETVFQTVKAHKDIEILAPTLPRLESQVKNLLQEMPCKVHITSDPSLKWSYLLAMDGAIAVSGTVGLELACCEIPHMIAYKMNSLTAHYVKRKIVVKYAHLANILLEDRIVPEFIQKDCNAIQMTDTLRNILYDDLTRKKQANAFQKLKSMLQGGEPTQTSSYQASEFILELNQSRSDSGTYGRDVGPV